MTEQELKTSNMCEASKGKQERTFFFPLVEHKSNKAIKLICVRKKICVGYFPILFK